MGNRDGRGGELRDVQPVGGGELPDRRQVSRLEARAHTWVSESSGPHGSEQPFEEGWFAGGRAVSSYCCAAPMTLPLSRARPRAVPNCAPIISGRSRQPRRRHSPLRLSRLPTRATSWRRRSGARGP
jgi:hypothetical protein